MFPDQISESSTKTDRKGFHMTETYVICLNLLQIFADGAGAGAGEGGAAGTGGTADAAGQQTTTGDKNPLANVLYGKQDAEPASAQAPAAQETIASGNDDPEAAFEALIKGQYKEQYNRRVQDTVQKRLKATKDKVDRYDTLSPILSLLGDKYGVDANDAAALRKAIEEDDTLIEEEAIEKGLTTQQLREIKKMKRENAELRAAVEAQQQQDQIEQDLAKWIDESKEAAKAYPGLDLRRELGDPQTGPQMLELLRSGISLEAAYFAIHHRELIPRMQQFAATQAMRQTADSIRAGSARPAENGMRGTAAATVKTDVSQLTKADRQEIIRRVAMGERIRF